MKTVDYIGFAPGHQYPLPVCPNCGYSSFRTIESKQSKIAQRRRKKCDKCGHRATTHEVTDEFFQEAKANQILIQKIKKLFNLGQLKEELKPVVETNRISCIDCSHNNGSRCSFGFPEYDTEDAYDCLHYKANS